MIRFMEALKTVVVQVAAGVVVATCLPLASWANSRDDQQVENAECHPMTVANQILRTAPGFQSTIDAVVEDETQRVLTHTDLIYDHGLQYARAAPFAAWRVKPSALVDPPRSDCHLLREEILDGARMVVISYVRYHPDFGTPQYRCTIWLAFPDYRNTKMECASVYPADRTKLVVRWFYRTDIKPPIVP